MLIDSHCHLDMLDLSKYDGDLALAVKAAKENDVGHMLCVCVDLKKFPQLVSIAERFSDISLSVGAHPADDFDLEPTFNDLITLGQHPLVIAVGETGLDYHHVEAGARWQKDRFVLHIQAANHLKKPLIIHTRNAREDTIAIMKAENAADCGGVMHCFTETWDMAKKALDLGFYISFSGIVTFKNAKNLQEVAKKVPSDRMLIETDAPFLAPTPYRGKPNEPAYVKYVAECLAQLRGVSYDDIAKQTTSNFFKLFHR